MKVKDNKSKVKEGKIEDKLVEAHEKFLDSLKDNQPLAFMASLSIVIAAFSQSYSTTIQSYAIGAASVFLLAFISSFLLKFFQTYALAILSYSLTAIGVILLLIITTMFSSLNEVIQLVFSVNSIILSIILFGIIPLYYLLERFKKESEHISKKYLSIYILAFAGVIILISFPLLLALKSVFNIEIAIPYASDVYLLGFIFLGICGLIIGKKRFILKITSQLKDKLNIIIIRAKKTTLNTFQSIKMLLLRQEHNKNHTKRDVSEP